jgi:hypothetical protein
LKERLQAAKIELIATKTELSRVKEKLETIEKICSAREIEVGTRY